MKIANANWVKAHIDCQLEAYLAVCLRICLNCIHNRSNYVHNNGCTFTYTQQLPLGKFGLE